MINYQTMELNYVYLSQNLSTFIVEMVQFAYF